MPGALVIGQLRPKLACMTAQRAHRGQAEAPSRPIPSVALLVRDFWHCVLVSKYCDHCGHEHMTAMEVWKLCER